MKDLLKILADLHQTSWESSSLSQHGNNDSHQNDLQHQEGVISEDIDPEEVRFHINM